MGSFKQEQATKERLAALGLSFGKPEDIVPVKVETDGWEAVQQAQRLEKAGLKPTDADMKRAAALVQQKIDAIQARVEDDDVFQTLMKIAHGLIEAGMPILDALREVEKKIDEATIGGKIQIQSNPKGYNRNERRFFNKHAKRAQQDGFAFKINGQDFDAEGNAAPTTGPHGKKKRRKTVSGRSKGKR